MVRCKRIAWIMILFGAVFLTLVFVAIAILFVGFLGNLIFAGNPDMILPLVFLLSFLIVDVLLLFFYVTTIVLEIRLEEGAIAIRTVLWKIEAALLDTSIGEGKNTVWITVPHRGKTRLLSIYKSCFPQHLLDSVVRQLQLGARANK
jgi:hypothetical protein